MNQLKIIALATTMGMIIPRLVVFFLTVNVFVSAGADGVKLNSVSDKRIYGGVKANIADYPYQTVLEYENAFLCGGSLISTNHVLTAGHCCVNLRIDLFRVKLGYDGYWHSLPNQTSIVEQIYIHENYHEIIHQISVNDIALLKLSRTLIFNSMVQPIPLASYRSSSSSSSCTVTGFGHFAENAPLSSYLMKADVPLATKSACVAALKAYLPNVYFPTLSANICTLSNLSRTTCSGDSGGPLMRNGIQIGIVSWGIPPCGLNNNPTFYTDVSKYINWINMKKRL